MGNHAECGVSSRNLSGTKILTEEPIRAYSCSHLMKVHFLAFIVLSAAFISGCTGTGRDFQYSGPASLQLGQTRRSDYKVTGGIQQNKVMDAVPQNVTKVNNGDGNFEIVKYDYVLADLSTARERALILEFRNGVLNAYEYISSFDHDKTTITADHAQLEKIQRGISTKKDVLAIMGEPHGKGLCPSMLSSFEDKCAKGIEVWAWGAMKPFSSRGIPFGGGGQFEMSNVIVTFDSKGIVTDVESSNYNFNQ